MKKLFAILTLFLTSLFLVSCEPEIYFFNYNDLESEVINVELIEYSNYYVFEISDVSEISGFDMTKSTELSTLDNESLDDFLIDVTKIELHNYVTYSNTPSGICVKINYTNGDFLILSSIMVDEISYGGAYLYMEDGTLKEFYGRFASRYQYVNLVKNHFDIDIV